MRQGLRDNKIEVYSIDSQTGNKPLGISNYRQILLDNITDKQC